MDATLFSYLIPAWQVYAVVCAILTVIWVCVWLMYRVTQIAFMSIFALSILAYFMDLLPFRNPPIPVVSLAITIIAITVLLWPILKAKIWKRSSESKAP